MELCPEYNSEEIVDNFWREKKTYEYIIALLQMVPDWALLYTKSNVII